MQPKLASAAIYARISEDRAGAGLAVDRQEADCRELSAKLDLVVTDDAVYVDNDVSATTGKRREAFERLLADARLGCFEYILAWHNDRLYRLPADLERVVKVIEETGVSVRTVQSGELDLSTPHGRLAASMFAGINRYEGEQKVIRQKAQSLQAAMSGEARSGGVRPFGYNADGTLNDREAHWVREGTRRVLDGQSLMSIIRDMNEAGVLTSRERPWTYPSLTAVLTRWRNAGVRQHQGKPLFDVAAKWEPLVSREDLEAVRALLSDPARRTTPGRARRHLLSFILRCGRCGGPMRAGQTSSRGRTYPIYQCHGMSGCRLAIAYDIAEKEVLSQVFHRLTFPGPELQDFTRQSRQELSELRVRRAQLSDVASDIKARELDVRDKAELLEDVEGQRRALDARIDESTQRASVAHVLGLFAEMFEQNRASLAVGVRARQAFAEMALERRREVVKALLQVTVHPARLGVQYRGGRSAERIEIVSLDPNTGEPLREQERWS